MIYISLFFALCCCITGVFVRKDTARKTESRVWIISGALLIFTYLIFLLFKVYTGIIFIVALLVIIGIPAAVKFKDYPLILLLNSDTPPIATEKLIVRQNNLLKWSGYSLSMLAIAAYLIYHPAIFARSRLDNDTIRIGGVFGSKFNIADIQSVDTVGVLPKIDRGSAPMPIVGTYKVENEEKKARLFIYNNKAPIIKIRMLDDRLLFFSFRNPNKTMAFYGQLQNTL